MGFNSGLKGLISVFDVTNSHLGYDMIYLLTAIGLSPGGSTHLHTNNTQNNTNNKECGRVRAVPRLCKFYPGIYLTTVEKAQKNLSQGKENLSQVNKNLS